MEWLTCIRASVDYMERHLVDDIGADDVAKAVYLSPFFLQRGFSLMTGVGIGEYLKNRRLYQAALDLRHTDDKVIDVALRYCYETPESFTKAFTRFHGATPSQVRGGAPIRTFLPLTIHLTIQGGNQMDCRITQMDSFKVIGFERTFDNETAYKKVPAFWDEIVQTYCANVWAGNPPANAFEKAVADHHIGEYGVCVDDLNGNRFRYLIAGEYMGGDVPEGMTVYELPRGDWAIFDCTGPLPEALQSVNTRIFKEWLPGNPDYEFAGVANVEWYGMGDTTAPDYKSAIWIPIKRRKQ